jgi:hypothetical protein
VAQSGAFWVRFLHLYTSVNGLGKRDANTPSSWSAIHLSRTSAPSKGGQMPPQLSRHPRFHRSLLIAGIGFDFCPGSGRYWPKSLSAIVLLLSGLASIFTFLVPHSLVCPRLESGLPGSAELPSDVVPTFGASEFFGTSLPFAAAA